MVAETCFGRHHSTKGPHVLDLGNNCSANYAYTSDQRHPNRYRQPHPSSLGHATANYYTPMHFLRLYCDVYQSELLYPRVSCNSSREACPAVSASART